MTDEKAPAEAQLSTDNIDQTNGVEPLVAHEKADENSPRQRWGVILVIMLASFVAGAGGVGYFSWFKVETLNSDLDDVRTAIQAQVVHLEATQENSRKLLLKEVGDRTAKVEARLQEFNNSLNSLSTLVVQATQSDQDGLVIAEVDYLLQLANYRIELEHNRDGALLAISRAQGRLGSLSAAAYEPILEQIAADKTALEGVVVPKVSAIVDTLTALLAQVDDLGAGAEKIAPQGVSPSADKLAAGGWPAFVSAFSENLSQFVEIDRAEGSAVPTLIPNQAHFAKENVRISLQNARASAVRRDTENFHLALTEAGLWLKSQFGSSSPIPYMEGELERLRQIQLVPTFPTLNASLALIRKLSQSSPTSPDPGEKTTNQTSAEGADVTTDQQAKETPVDTAVKMVDEVLEAVSAGSRDTSDVAEETSQ